MESASEITIFGQKIMVKSGLEKIFLKFLQFILLHPLEQKVLSTFQFEGKNDVLIGQVRPINQSLSNSI